jgi:hypothetical protein
MYGKNEMEASSEWVQCSQLHVCVCACFTRNFFILRMFCQSLSLSMLYIVTILRVSKHTLMDGSDTADRAVNNNNNIFEVFIALRMTMLFLWNYESTRP